MCESSVVSNWVVIAGLHVLAVFMIFGIRQGVKDMLGELLFGDSWLMKAAATIFGAIFGGTIAGMLFLFGCAIVGVFVFLVSLYVC